MKPPQTLSLGDRGFDLVLGGGVRVVERVPGRSGAAVLVRGPGGSGKTSLGLHLAIAAARALQGAVAYGCVELLPTELEAQLYSLWGTGHDVHVIHADAPRPDGDDGVFLHARVLDLREGPGGLGDALEQFFRELDARGARPAVLVVDSLSDGYGLGAGVSREFADAICKITAHLGVVLVLLEECADDAPSPWVYAADTVIELGVVSEDADATRASPFERRLSVVKHRFGPSDHGPHRFAWEAPGALRVYPRPSAWLEPWAAPLTGIARVERAGPSRFVLRLEEELTVEGSVLAVFGPDQLRAQGIVWGAVPADPGAAEGRPDLHVEFDRPIGTREDVSGSDRSRRHVGVAHPYLSAHRLVRTLVDAVAALGEVRRVVLGDLQVLRSWWGEDGLRRGVAVFCQLMRDAGVPVVLHETSPSRVQASFQSGGSFYALEPGVAEARAVDLADISVEVFSSGIEGVLSLDRVAVKKRRPGK